MKTVTVSLTPEVYCFYQELSRQTGESPEKAMRRLLEEFLQLASGVNPSEDI